MPNIATMKNLLRIELLKIINYPTFWAILLLHAMFYFVVVALGANLNINVQGIQLFRFFSGEYIWGTIAWIASWFNLLLAILIIVLVGNELLYNTFRRQLLDGLTRNQLVFSKTIVVVLLSVFVILLVTISGIIVKATYSDAWQGSFFYGFKYVFVLGVQSFAYMSLAMLVILLFRNIALSIIVYLLYFILMEPFLRLFFESNIDVFFPMKLISNLTPMPDFMGMLTSDLSNIQGVDPSSVTQLQSIPEGLSLGVSVSVCVVYIVIFLVSSRLLLKFRDL